MKQGWIYVVELAPTGYIKVGRSDNPTKRISDHVANAAFGGAAVIRFASFAVDDAADEEDRVLHHFKWKKGVVLAHGRETFSGMTFSEALLEIDALLNKPAAPALRMEDVLVRAAEIMDEHGLTRVLMSELHELMGAYGPATKKELGQILGRNGVARGTVYSRRLKREGYGVKRENLPVARAA